MAASTALCFSASLRSGEPATLDPMVSLGWLLFAIVGVMVFFTPFLLSLLTYLPLHRHRCFRRRLPAALYGATWHVSAHVAVVGGLGGDVVNFALLAPLIVGGLWGSWLPDALRDGQPFPWEAEPVPQ